MKQQHLSRYLTQAQKKATEAWQDEQWAKRRHIEDRPEVLDVFESAAYLRVSPDTIRDAVAQARDGTAKLPHQRIGKCGIIRIRRRDLDALGSVRGRAGG